MYAGDWLARLSRLVREPANPRLARVPRNVWGLGLTSMFTDISSEMVISILPAYMVLTGGFAPLALGIATGVHEGGPLLATWVGGLIADRSGRRKLTAGCGYGISAVCRLGWLLMPGRTIAGITALIVGDRIGKSIRTAPRDAIISLSAAPDQAATAFGVHRALDALGAAGGPMLAFVLLWRLPQRYDVVFFTSFVAAVLGVSALILFVQESAAGGAARARTRLAWDDALGAFADPHVRRILVLAIAFGMVTISDAFVYLLLVQRAHGNPYWVPLLYTGTAISFLLLAIPVGALADRIGRQLVFIAGHAPLLLAYFAAIGGPRAWPWSAVACVICLGAYYASTEGVLAGLAGTLLPSGSRSIGLAWVATSVAVARLCSSVVFGWLWTSAGDLDALLVFASSLVMVAGAALWMLASGRMPAEQGAA